MPPSSILLARQIRRHALEMVAQARSSHLGGAFSMADLLAVLYDGILQVRPDQPRWPERDRFILSKGHCATALYAVLARRGFFPMSELATFGQPGGRLLAHASHHVPGVEFSTGSLGHGLPYACGVALAGRRRSARWKVVALLSDGELDEGSNWEAILFAAHHRLDNLLAVIDFNQIQSLGRVEEVMGLEPLADKFRAFGWAVREADGHDHAILRQHLGTLPWESGRPSCLIARTIKGKGVDFMENDLLWHYRPPDSRELAEARRQLPDSP